MTTLEHPQIVSKLERRLRVKLGCVTTTCENYKCNGIVGEVDLYGFDFKHQVLYAIEVKGRDNQNNSTKAYHQLNKDEVYLRRLFHDFEPFKLVRLYAHSDKTKRQRYDVVRL